MPGTLSLSAYLAFAKRQAPSQTPFTHPRPPGALIWLHCSEPDRARQLIHFGQRLAESRDGATVLLTTIPGIPKLSDLPENVIWQECPTENPDDAIAFLIHWRPELLIWVGSGLRPALIVETHRRSIPCLLIEVDVPVLDHRRLPLIGPEPIRGSLSLFSSIFAVSDEAKTRLQRLIPDAAKVIQTNGRLSDDAPVLPCNDSDLEELRTSFAGRPVWVAAHLQLSELPIVLDAFRKVLRVSHRMVLVVVPAQGSVAKNFSDMIAQQHWRAAFWEDGEIPDDNTQIVVTEGPQELGLWYRIAPISFVGSSLANGHGGRDPLVAAGLGSAVIHGPNMQQFKESYDRLMRMDAAIVVKDLETLTNAVSRLTAAEKVAAMAHGGWLAIAEAADVSNRVIQKSNELLDGSEDLE